MDRYDNLSSSHAYTINMQLVWHNVIHWIKYMLYQKGYQFSFKRFFCSIFYMIWQLVVESNSHIHHTFPEEVNIAKWNM